MIEITFDKEKSMYEAIVSNSHHAKMRYYLASLDEVVKFVRLIDFLQR